MKESLAVLASALFTVAACWAAGIVLIERIGARLARLERFPLAFLTGASILHLFVFAVMTAHLAYKATWAIALTLLIMAGAWRAKALGAEDDRKLKPGLGTLPRVVFAAIFAAFGVRYLVNAWAPEISPDGASYHLEIIGRYLRAHGFFAYTTNMYAGLGQGIELVYAPAFALGRHASAALVHFAFLIALAMALFAYGRRIGKPLAGAAAALLVFLSPVVGIDASTAYIDVATAAVAFALFYWLEIWDEVRDARLLVPIGLLAGYAYAAKYTAFVLVPYALLFVLWRSRKIRPALIVAALAAVMIAPWMIKNWVYLHNPVAPFANEWFPNPFFHPITIQDWSQYLRRYDVANLWTLPWLVTVDGGKTEGIIGPVFLLAPLALLALRLRPGRRLLAMGFVLLSTYFANVGTRFLIPCLPFFALALALALARPAIVLMLIVVLDAFASWPEMLPRYAHRYVWKVNGFPWRAAIGKESREHFLEAHLWRYGLIRVINEKVPADERILSLSGLSTAYLRPELLQSFQSASSATMRDFLDVAEYPELQARRALIFHFPQRAMRRLRLLETARAEGPHQWNVHELRFFDQGREVPRASAWRLRAHPDPWEVQLAFDNSPVTRWRSWQPAQPGMFLEVDFGREQKVDEVRMETSHDYEWPIRLRVETMDGGEWKTVTDQFREEAVQYNGSPRLAAAYELAARGIHYLLIQDDDWGAADFNGDPEAWGLVVVGRAAGGTLFRIAPENVKP